VTSPVTEHEECTAPADPPKAGLGAVFLGLGLFLAGGVIPAMVALIDTLMYFSAALQTGAIDEEIFLTEFYDRILSAPYILASLVLSWVGLLTPVMIASTRKGRDWKSILQWRFRPSRDIPLAIGITVAYRLVEMGVLSVLTGPLGVNSEELGNADFLTQTTGVWLVALALAAAIGAPVVEEVFFRGYFLTAVRQRLGALPGIAITSLTFGFLHIQGSVIGGLFIFLSTTLIGFILATLVIKTGRLGASITTHILFNASGVALVLLTVGAGG